MLAPFTTLGVGGPAKYFVEAETEEQVIEAFHLAREKGIDVLILGGGSNMVVSDSGFPGLVLKIGIKGIDISYRPGKDDARLSAGAGEAWDGLVLKAVENDLAGIECMSGIPGLVGGTPVQNVGAYGQEVSESIISVRCYDRTSQKIVELENHECNFSYRTSIFNSSGSGRYVVLGVVYKLKAGGAPKLAYPELRKEVEISGRDPRTASLAEVRQAVIAIRRRKSMVIDRDDPNSRSAGSFFKNPVVTKEVFLSVAAVIPDPPSFPMQDGRVKIPAAWLIERSGFHKGYTLGNVGISENHSLAIVNKGGATAAEVLDLMKEIERGVKGKFGIDIYPEPVFVGF